MRKLSIFLIFLLLLGGSGYFFLKPLTLHFLSKDFSKKLREKVELTSLTWWPLTLDGVITLEHYDKPIVVHAKYTGEFTIDKKKLGPVIMTSDSLGGLVTLTFIDQTKLYDFQVENVDFKEFASALGDKGIIHSGTVNGYIKYYKKTKTGHTNLRITDAEINAIDVEKDVTRVNNALKLDVINLVSNKVKNNYENGRTKVDKAQFDIELKDKTIYTKDVALRNDQYRIVLTGNTHQRGKINEMYVHLVDKHGCAMVTQTIKGSIQRPKITHTSTKVVKVVRDIPTSIFSLGRRFMKYGERYVTKQKYFSEKDFALTSDIMDNGDYVFKYSSKNVLPKDCKVIYNGVIRHPQKH